MPSLHSLFDTMKIAVVSNLESSAMQVIEKIKEQAMSMNIGIGEIAPVNRLIDIPMAVRKLSERPDIDSVILAVDFPELKMEHESPLLERIKAEVNAISMEMKKPVSMELMDADMGELGMEKIRDVLEKMGEKENSERHIEERNLSSR